MNTTYHFTKGSSTYSTRANNAVEAREKLELQFGIDMTGAKLEIMYKLRVIETRTVK